MSGLGLNQQTIAMYATPMSSNEIDMVYHTGVILKDMVHENASNIFLTHPYIVTVNGLTSGSQRVMINRFFVELLLKYRATSNTSVELYLSYLISDGEIEDWFKLFKEIIIPFIKENKLLG